MSEVGTNCNELRTSLKGSEAQIFQEPLILHETQSVSKPEILHEPTEIEPFVVLKKPASLPSAPLIEGEEGNAFYYAQKLFPSLKNVHGKKECEHGLLHRLDTRTEGLLLIAESQEFYDALILQQEEGLFVKTYRANCKNIPTNTEILQGYPPLPLTRSDTLSSYFRSFGKSLKEVRPVTEQSGMAALKKIGKKVLYQTEVKLLGTERQATFECSIKKGFRHQVRSHLSWLNYPVIGDELYNAEDKKLYEETGVLKPLNFFAVKIEFINPLSGENQTFSYNPTI